MERIEREYSQYDPGGAPEPEHQAPAVAMGSDWRIGSDKVPPPPRSRRGIWTAAVVGVLVIAIGVGGYAAWSAFQTMAPKPPTTTAAKIEAALHDPPLRRRPTVTASAVDLAPGVDGGSTDADVSYIFRRQRVYYRTTLPPGTIVVDKPQHFMYLVLPNSAALRYGIGVGTPCAELVGPRKISNKVEWPEWTPPPGSSRSAPMPGGPGNPLGARLLDLDDNTSRIHGTNAPKTIGEDVTLGCVRLVNDDVADLYNRVPVGTRVVMR
jgi:lipoprotein-anchoring transpeptidase ErfK/SrfK